MSYQFTQLTSDYKALQKKVIRLDNQLRRDNLLFYGVSEEKGETDNDCARKVYDLLVRQAGIPPPVSWIE